MPHRWNYFAQRRAIVAHQKKRGLGAKLYRVWWWLNIDVGLHVMITLLASVLKSPKLVRVFYRHVLAKIILKNRTFVDHSEPNAYHGARPVQAP